jgi:hypothetical protein
VKKLFYIGIIAFATSFTSCKIYSFTGASIAPDIKTISIANFENYASLAPGTMSQTFTEALKDIFIAQTNLRLTDKYGDLQFEGEIVDYIANPVAISGGDQAALNRLSITVNVRFTNTKDETQTFEQRFTRFSDFESSRNLADVEAVLIRQINEQLVQDIFNKSVSNW